MYDRYTGITMNTYHDRKHDEADAHHARAHRARVDAIAPLVSDVVLTKLHKQAQFSTEEVLFIIEMMHDAYDDGVDLDAVDDAMHVLGQEAMTRFSERQS